MDVFKAFRIFNENDKIAGRVVETRLEELSPGEVVFKTAYSSVNYKDALAGTGTGGKIIRNYPLTGGIDAAGIIVSSSDSRFKACAERLEEILFGFLSGHRDDVVAVPRQHVDRE